MTSEDPQTDVAILLLENTAVERDRERPAAVQWIRPRALECCWELERPRHTRPVYSVKSVFMSGFLKHLSKPGPRHRGRAYTGRRCTSLSHSLSHTQTHTYVGLRAWITDSHTDQSKRTPVHCECKNKPVW